MNEKITPLIRLQELDKALDALRQNTGRLAPRREALKARAAALALQLENGKRALTDAQVQKKNLEIETDTQDQLVRKHSAQLNSVKSNDAYKALLSEIDAAKKQKSALEDQILALMETIEKLQKRSKEDDAAAQRERTEIDAEGAALNAEESALTAELAARQAERDAFAAGIPADARERYEAVQRGRPGFVAVVPANDMTCGGCRTRLTADTINQAMKGKELVACESCSRILYIVPKPAVAS